MSFHSDLSSKKSQRLRQDGRTIDFYGKKVKSKEHSASSSSAERKVKSSKLRSKSGHGFSFPSSHPIQAKKITFYRNGDAFFKGIVFAISSRVYPSIDSLLLDANRHPICDVSVLPKGIRYLFSSDGKLVTSLNELQEGKGYVFSSTETFKPLQYGGNDPILLRGRLAADPHLDMRVSACSSYNVEEQDHVDEGCEAIELRTIYIIRAGPRPRYTTKLTLSQGAANDLDQVISCIEQNLMMCKGGIKHLCSVSGNEVKCLEDLFEEDTIFIAFGTEVISPDDLLLSAAELSTSPVGTPMPSVAWTNKLPRFPSDIRKPKIITVVNRGHSGDERGIPFALLSKYRVGKTVIWTDCAVMKRCYTKTGLRQAVAMKIFEKSRLSSDELDAVYYELSMLRRLKHNNILHFVDEMDTIPELYVLVEYFKGTNLFEAIVLSKFFTENEAGVVLTQLCSAISYLHSLCIIHRNVKPENIMVSCDRHVDWQLRLVGLSSAVQIKEGSVSELCGTLEYTAPEILKGLGYGSKVDVWSAGVVCYQMLSGLLPFSCSEGSGDQQHLIQNIVSGHVDFPSPFWDLISDSVKDLILHMLTKNPKLRCKASDVFSHSWFQTTTYSPTSRRKNVDIRSTVAANLGASNPWASKTAKSSHMLLASSFCSPRKAYEERTSSPDHKTRHSFSAQSVLSCSDSSDKSLFKLPVAPPGYRYISYAPAISSNQNDAICEDTNPSLDRDSLLLTDKAIAHVNNVESGGFDLNSSQSCMDQSNTLLCDRVDIDSLKTDATSDNFDYTHFCQENGLTGTNSSKSDILSSHSVSTHTSHSDRCIRTAKHPCTAATQTTSSELFITSAICPAKALANNSLSSSSSSAAPSVVAPNGAEVTHPRSDSTHSKVPFPLSFLFSKVSPTSTYSVKPPARNTGVSFSTDYQLSGGLPSGDHSSSGKLTITKSTSSGSPSSSVNPAHMENHKLFSNQSLTRSHGQNNSPPVLTLQPTNPSSSAFNHAGLPVLQFVSSTKSASPPPKKSLLKNAHSSSPLTKSCLASKLQLSQHSTQAHQHSQLAPARSSPQYDTSPIQDSQHIQTLPWTSALLPQALTAQSNISPSMPANRNGTAVQHGFFSQPRESNGHSVHRQSLSISYASADAGVDQPQSPVTRASPSQILTAALKSTDLEDQGHTKDARLLPGNQRMTMNLAKMAVETVCWTPSSNVQKEQTGERQVPPTSPVHNKDSSPAASSSSSNDEFLSPSSSIHRGSQHSSQTHLSAFSEDDNDDAESTSSWSTHGSTKNLS